MYCLDSLGWNAQLEQAFMPYAGACVPARVALEHRSGYQVMAADGDHAAVIAGRLRYVALSRSDLPAVGDWVAVSRPDEGGPAVIQAVLPRSGTFSRKVVGNEWDEQVVAANVTTLFLVSALNRDFNPRRIERYLVLARESGAEPVLVLNKADLCEDRLGILQVVQRLAPDTPCLQVSAETGEGLEGLAAYLEPGRTVALLGSSGVGKSTLINRLVGREVNRTHAAREDDDRGRHTTTHRELVPLPGGGVLIDTPGMRELGLWDSQEGLQRTFADLEAIALRCRFRDCRHGNEPGCAVQAAIASGDLDAGRLASYRKLDRELHYQEMKTDPKLQREEKERWKKIHKAHRRRDKEA